MDRKVGTSSCAVYKETGSVGRKEGNSETVELISSRCTWGGVKKLREENRGR
jgi:hypothetical protein